MVAPLLVGCGSKTDTEQDPATSANQQPYDSVSPIEPTVSEPIPFDPTQPGGLSGEVVSDADESNEADQPKSLFRSIGRALQRGVTDAAGSSSDSSDDPPESADTDPTDPR
jgi:hypothetical protein